MYETSLRARIIPKVFIFLKIISLIFCLGHLIFSVIFFGQGAFIFCGYNVLSTIFYAVLCHSTKCLTSKNIKAVANILTHITVELSIFITVSLLLVGSPSGFQHYIYGIFIFIMFENYISSNTTKSVLLILFSCLCTFIPSLFLYHIDSYYSFNNGLASAFDIVNPLVVIALFISYIFIFGNIITNFEDDIIYQAYHDKLTGLHNRTLLNQLTFDSDNTYVAILDIDDFKKVNDTFGHDVGDLVLKHLSKVLTLEARVNHGLYIMRWGGEEFVLVYNNKDFLDIVNAIRDDILQSYVDIGSRKIIYRVTVGVADYNDGRDLEELIKVADERLYLGKKSGKNKIMYKE